MKEPILFPNAENKWFFHSKTDNMKKQWKEEETERQLIERKLKFSWQFSGSKTDQLQSLKLCWYQVCVKQSNDWRVVWHFWETHGAGIKLDEQAIQCGK